MATYSIDQIIGAAKGLKNWYDYWVSGWRIVKQNSADISNLVVGSPPGFGSAIDVRQYLLDTSSSATTYTAIATPAATGSDSIPTGWGKTFVANNNNTGACTLNVGSLDGVVAFKKYVDGSKVGLEADDLQAGVPTLIQFDGTDFVVFGIGSSGDVTPPAHFLY
jgi:hypothetical protein